MAATPLFVSFNFLLLVSFTMASYSPFVRRRCLQKPPLICILRQTTNSLSSSTSGTVLFTPAYIRLSRRRFRCRVHVTANLTNFSPGLHGFHIHTYGDLSKTDGTSAGGHFSNPRGTPVAHGLPSSFPRHWGDLGNVNVSESGTATFEHTDRVIRLRGIVGRGMIVHALEDQGREQQPTGEAGARQEMCVICFASALVAEQYTAVGETIDKPQEGEDGVLDEPVTGSFLPERKRSRVSVFDKLEEMRLTKNKTLILIAI